MIDSADDLVKPDVERPQHRKEAFGEIETYHTYIVAYPGSERKIGRNSLPSPPQLLFLNS